MRVIHISDWHGNLQPIPEADLYVVTGDMLPNFPDVYNNGSYVTYKIKPMLEFTGQHRWCESLSLGGGFRDFLGSPDAPLVCVRGNHDFIDLSTMFDGCNLIHEFVDNEFIVVPGLNVNITGHRGIPYIYGSWNDEESRADLKDRMRRMPHADIYLTHYAPSGILDASAPPDEGFVTDYGAAHHYGLEGMADELLYRSTKGLHCFGHIHECGGLVKKIGNVSFSNAATAVNVIDIDI